MLHFKQFSKIFFDIVFKISWCVFWKCRYYFLFSSSNSILNISYKNYKIFFPLKKFLWNTKTQKKFVENFFFCLHNFFLFFSGGSIPSLVGRLLLALYSACFGNPARSRLKERRCQMLWSVERRLQQRRRQRKPTTATTEQHAACSTLNNVSNNNDECKFERRWWKNKRFNGSRAFAKLGRIRHLLTDFFQFCSFKLFQ